MSYFGPAAYNTGHPIIDVDGLMYHMMNVGASSIGVRKVNRNLPSRRSLFPHLYLGDKVLTKEFLQTCGNSNQYLFTAEYPIIVTIKEFKAEDADKDIRQIMANLDAYVSARENFYDYPTRLQLELSVYDNTVIESAPLWSAPITAILQFTDTENTLSTYS